MGFVISLDLALDRLLHRRSDREAFLAGRLDALDLDAEAQEALAGVDRGQLQRTAEKVREALLRRGHRGSGGLLALYPRTLGAWTAAHPEDAELVELLSAFMESAPFDAYRELPFAGAGLCLEEAFHRFCEAAEIGDAAVREQEYLAAVTKALLLSPEADFVLPAALRRAPRGVYAVSTRGAPTLYAALAGRFVTGSITPFLAELLTGAAPPEETARRHGVGEAALQASWAQLAGMGLVGSGG